MKQKFHSVQIVGWLAVIVFLLLGFELLSFVGTKHVLAPRAPFLVYAEPGIDAQRSERYLKVRDPMLGWPRLDMIGSEHFDAVGSRPVPAFPEPRGVCISLYGDSYTYGDEVKHAEAWGNVLSQRIGCRVANFGVPGYGTDQALMRFERNTDDESKIVILGILHENIMRIVNQYRYFVAGADPYGFKPRFVLDGDRLRRVPISVASSADIARAIAAPGKAFAHEWFLPGSSDGPVAAAFPYTQSLIQFAVRTRNWRIIGGEPSWLFLYAKDHPSRALELMTRIGREFRDLARQRGKTPLVVIFPTPASYKYWTEHGENAGRPLVQSLKNLGIDTIDLIESFPGTLRGDRYCAILSQPDACTGHFNPEGNRLVADIVRRHLEAKKLADVAR